MVAGKVAAVVGAGGGIGRALVRQLAETGEYRLVHGLSRQTIQDRPGVRYWHADVGEEESIQEAAARIGDQIDLFVIATGMLHDDAIRPERALRELDPQSFAKMFAINAIGPAIVLKHFSSCLVRDKPSAVAALSARVGSISDNRLGGWYSYRASKAALNMIVKTAAIELSRTRPQAVCVALHPGTVDTDLSRPFQRGVAQEKLLDPDRAARQLLATLVGLTPQDSGRIFAWDGREITP